MKMTLKNQKRNDRFFKKLVFEKWLFFEIFVFENDHFYKTCHFVNDH